MLAFKRHPTLARLDTSQLAVLAEHARDRLFPRGAVLQREGEPIESVYYIVEGRAHLTLRGRTLGDAGPGRPREPSPTSPATRRGWAASPRPTCSPWSSTPTR